jgi:hypothetical protein
MTGDEETFVLSRNDLKRMRWGWDRYDKKVSASLEAMNSQIAGLFKILSSIEMELLIQRCASLDNNFEGKQEL